MKKIVSLVLSLVMILSMSVPAFATNSISDNNNAEQVFIVDVSMTSEEALLLAYESLTPEAKAIFEAAIANSLDAITYHRSHIDANYEIPQALMQSAAATAAAVDAVRLIQNGLTSMYVPEAVNKAMTLFASGISAALFDGPLPFGDIYAIAVAAYTAVVVAEHWDDVVSLWDDIVELFQDVFDTISSEIANAMSSIKVDIEDEYSLPDTVTVTYANRTFMISGTRYVCTVLAENMGPTDNRFYPAAIFGSVLYVCPTYIPFKYARAIIDTNIPKTGVFTRHMAAARSLCTGGTAIEHHSHENQCPDYASNYFPHFHRVRGTVKYNTHAWYVM